MADITFGGLATGLPTDDIIEQLIAVERLPIDRLEAQKVDESERLGAYKQLDTRLKDLRDAVAAMNITSEVRAGSVQLSSEENLTATSTGGTSGSFDVAVVQLAQVQKSVSSGYSSSTDSVLGTGTITIGSETINITSDNNSLQGLADAINARAEELGVQANIINDGTDGDAYHLVLTGQDAQTSFTLTSDLVDSEDTAIDFSLTDVRSAQQAVAFVDGIRVVSDSNEVSGVVPGVTLHLNKASSTTYAGTAEEGVDSWDWADPPQYDLTQMTVSADTDVLKEKITTFVDSYNAVMDWISAGYDEFGATAPTDEEIAAGEEDILSDLVRGDSTVNGVKRQLQSILASSFGVEGTFKVMGQLGISTRSDGSIGLDETKLDSALEDNFDDVATLLVGDENAEGVMKRFNTVLLEMTGYGTGMYAEKQNAYNIMSERIDSQIRRLEPLIDKKEETLRARFSAMELLVSELNSQSSFLTQQMESLSNMSGN